MHNFSYYSPTKLIFGAGSVPALVPELRAAGIERVLLLTGGSSVHASGLFATVVDLLRQAGIEVHPVEGVQPNPRLEKVREAVQAAKNGRVQAILPIGGGSVFDSAKAVAAGAASEHDVWELVTRAYPVAAALPIYGILTLSGTSSEVNNTSVITNSATQEKFPFVSDLIYPRVSIVDPALQYNVPLQQVRHSGLDALSHVLEAYFSGLDTTEVIVEHCEAYARGILRCLSRLPSAQNDYTVRAELAFCSVYAHSGWASLGRPVRGDFSSHRIGIAMSALFDTPHGVTLGIIMPHWMRYVYDLGLGHPAMARFAVRILGLTDAPGDDFALAGIKAFQERIRMLGMPTRMSEVGIKQTDIPALAENAAKTLPFGSVRPMNLDTITDVLNLAL